MPVSKNRKKPSKGGPKPVRTRLPTKIVMANSAYLQEVRLMFVEAVQRVTPYRLNADGDKMLDAFHPSAFQPYCRPVLDVNRHPNGCRMKSIDIRRSDKPFEGLGPEPEQREGSRRIYCLEESAIDLFMSNFTVNRLALAAEAKARKAMPMVDPHGENPGVTLKVEDGGTVIVPDLHEEAVDLDKLPEAERDDIIDAEFEEVTREPLALPAPDQAT